MFHESFIQARINGFLSRSKPEDLGNLMEIIIRAMNRKRQQNYYFSLDTVYPPLLPRSLSFSSRWALGGVKMASSSALMPG